MTHSIGYNYSRSNSMNSFDTCTTGGVTKLAIGDIESNGGNSFKSNLESVGNSMVDLIGNRFKSNVDSAGHPFSISLVNFKACLQMLSHKAQGKSHVKRNSPQLVTRYFYDMFD